MSNKLKLTKLELQTKDGQKVELTLDEAKELHAQLHELFGDKTVYIPGAPVIIERDRWPRPYWGDWTITGDTSNRLAATAASGMTVGFCGADA